MFPLSGRHCTRYFLHCVDSRPFSTIRRIFENVQTTVSKVLINYKIYFFMFCATIYCCSSFYNSYHQHTSIRNLNTRCVLMPLYTVCIKLLDHEKQSHCKIFKSLSYGSSIHLLEHGDSNHLELLACPFYKMIEISCYKTFVRFLNASQI